MKMHTNLISEVQSYGEKSQIVTRVGSLVSFLIEAPDKNLPNNIKTRIFNEFYPIAMAAFNQQDSIAFQKDVMNHLFEADGLILMFNSDESKNRGVAFRTFSAINNNALYLAGVAIDPKFQGTGLYRVMIECIINKFDYVITRTQSAIVATMFYKIFKECAPITRHATEIEKEIANILVQKLNMEHCYDKNRLTGKGIYGGSLYQKLPMGDPAISKKLYSMIDVKRGDCVILISKAQ